MRLFVRGKKVVLRDFVLSDLSVLEKWLMPNNEWRRFDGPYYRQASIDSAKKLLSELEQHIKLSDWPTPREKMAIAYKDGNRLIGRVAAYWISKETNWLAIGIDIFDPELWGFGLGYEALGLWIEYQFMNRAEICRLDIRTWSGNQRMIKLAKKLGFKEEARFRKARIVAGEYYDGLGYGILREEWEEKYPTGFQSKY